MKVLGDNAGPAEQVPCTDAPTGTAGIGKRPVEGLVRVVSPGALVAAEWMEREQREIAQSHVTKYGQ